MGYSPFGEQRAPLLPSRPGASGNASYISRGGYPPPAGYPAAGGQVGARLPNVIQSFSISGSGATAERYPPVGEQNSAAQESFLPNHPNFRPEMELPKPGRDMYSFLPPQKKKQRISQEQVLKGINSKVEEIIEELSSKNKFLPSEGVRKITMDLISKARNQNNVNLSLRDIDAFSRFSKLHGRIDELIKVYCFYTPVTSVHELGVALAYSEKASSYEELHLGPLIQHPRVRDYFKPPEDLECAPEITVHQLHGHLTKMVDKSKRGSKHTLEEYLEFVRKKQGLESVAHLCVRIQSFPLLIQVGADRLLTGVESGW